MPRAPRIAFGPTRSTQADECSADEKPSQLRQEHILAVEMAHLASTLARTPRHSPGRLRPRQATGQPTI